MCLITFAYDCHPIYKLILAANRDEFYQRDDIPAGFWPDCPDLLAGRDLQHGGTWMGITRQGRFAALTNYRDPSSIKATAPSRGLLVQNYLTSDLQPESFIAGLLDGGSEYNGFNLLMGSPDSLFYYSNREKMIRLIQPGIHSLSNSLLDVAWPKVTKTTNGFSGFIKDSSIDSEDLFSIMANREQPSDQELPSTGVSLEFERLLGPAFVLSPEYGTKSTSVLLVGQDRSVEFWERSFHHSTLQIRDEVHFSFNID